MTMPNALVPVVGPVASLVLGTIFLWGGLGKLHDLRGFRSGVVDYKLLPNAWSRRVATLIAFVEPVLGLWLLTGIAPAYAGTAALGLLVVFATAVSINLARGHIVPCSCGAFGPDEPVGPVALVRLGLLAAGAAVLALGGEAATWRALVSEGGGHLLRDRLLPVGLLAVLALLALRLLPIVGPAWRAFRTPAPESALVPTSAGGDP